MTLSQSERAKRYQVKSKELGLCTVCTEPARLRQSDGKPSIYCDRHHKMKDARQNRQKRKRRLLVARLTGMALPLCSKCGEPGHNRLRCKKDVKG